MKKLLALVLLIVCSFSPVTKAFGYNSKPVGAVLGYRDGGYRPGNERRHEEERRRREDERRRQEDERRREEERRRREEECRRQEGERRRQEDERRRQEAERRRQEQEQRRQEERRRQDEERRRQEEERRRQAEERRRHEAEQRRHDDHRRDEEHRYRDRHAGSYGREDRRHDSGEKLRASRVLRETAECLARAQRAARSGNYRYGMGKAYAHQEQARKLYFDGWYQRAILHSMRAREIANYIIEANRSGGPRYGERHRRYQEDDSLDSSLSIRVVDDNMALKLKINLD